MTGVSWLLHNWGTISCTNWCSIRNCSLLNHPNSCRILFISSRRICSLLGGVSGVVDSKAGVLPSLQAISFLLRSLISTLSGPFRIREYRESCRAIYICSTKNVLFVAALGYLFLYQAIHAKDSHSPSHHQPQNPTNQNTKKNDPPGNDHISHLGRRKIIDRGIC